MDNPLTPSKIQRLIYLAEDRSFNNNPCRLNPSNIGDSNIPMDLRSFTQYQYSNNTDNCESSLGILDLERLPGIGEIGIGNMSVKSSAFNPGELTGRSTGTEDLSVSVNPVTTTKAFGEYGRHSVALDSITSHMDKQTLEINDIMRHSIASNFSFHSKRDLTADEASLVMREAPIPVQQSTQLNLQDSIVSNSNLSVGAYFKNRCPDFGKILSNTESPNRSMRPSITEVSVNATVEIPQNNPNSTYKMDNTLDSVPVRQPKSTPTNAQSTYILSNHNEIVDVNKNNEQKPVVNKGYDQKHFIHTAMKQPNQILTSHKMYSSKPADVLVRNIQSSFKLIPEEPESSLMENSLSISKIADYLGKESNISVTDMLQLNNQIRQANKKLPLSEVQLNMLHNKQDNHDVYVTELKDARKMETASSSGTVDTVISIDKLKISDEKKLPAVIVTRESMGGKSVDVESVQSRKSIRSKSPSSRSLSTVVENQNRSSSSPLQSSRGEANTSHIPSPNIIYKELDKSVDWHDVMKQKCYNEERFAKDTEQWVEISASPVSGFVGGSIAINLSITTLLDSWLTARFEFDSLPNGTIELPRGPLLLSPRKTDKFTLYITSNVEITTSLPFTVFLKDASIDCELEQKCAIEIDIKMPMIQAVSCDGVNKTSFPTIQENSSSTKYFVVLSDCPVDLQLELSVVEGDTMFLIRNIQEIKKGDVSKALMEKQCSSEEVGIKGKGKASNRQLCRLSSGNAIKVTITFKSPRLSDLDINDKMAVFNGCLDVKLIGVNTILKKVNLIGSVGVAHLEVQSNKVKISNDSTTIAVRNIGTVAGAWVVRYQVPSTDTNMPFQVSPSRFEARPEEFKQLVALYTGPQDVFTVGTMVLEEVTTGAITLIEICGGCDKKSFPIKTNYNNMSWVRNGRKELSLKNSTNKQIQIRCHIVGEGFSIDGESRGAYHVLSFGPCECRPLQITFNPLSSVPYAAALHLIYDKNNDYSRKILLHGCGSSESVRWSGLVTYGDTALVRAAGRRPVELALYNKSAAPAFIASTVQFNLQYRCVADEARIRFGQRVVRGRARHVVQLDVAWGRAERRARSVQVSTLATVTVLSGAEFTRQRILRIIRNKSTGELDTSMLPDHLKVLAENFDGQDPEMQRQLENFQETKSSLNDLIESLHELTAQIDLPQDFADDNTILISDDTVIEHHTLCD